MKTVVAQARGELAVNKRRLTRAFSPDEEAKAAAPPALYAFKQLRRLMYRHLPPPVMTRPPAL